MSRRIRYIDLMKGICIILVVLQHGWVLPDSTATRIYLSMNMPLFFFVSGMFLPSRKSFGEMIVGGINRLLIPWVVFALVAGLLIDVLLKGSAEPRPVYWLFTGPNVPLYFLRALFMATVVAWLAARACRTLAWQMAALAVFALLSWGAFGLSPVLHGLVGSLRTVALDSGLAEAAAMLVFLWLGHVLSEQVGAARLELSPRVAIPVFAAAAAAAWLVAPPRMRWHYVEAHGDWAPIMAGALCGIAAVWAAACVLVSVRPLAAAGRNSLGVLVTHYIILIALTTALGLTRRQAIVWVLAAVPAAVWACVRLLPWACARKPLLEWRDGRVHAAARLVERFNRMKRGIAEYFL